MENTSNEHNNKNKIKIIYNNKLSLVCLQINLWIKLLWKNI